jgi:hypothetical protein
MNESTRQTRNGPPAGEASGARPARVAGVGRAWLWALAPAAGFVAAGLWALRLGFRAVSDDDYARVLLAQRFAGAPRLDPTGSSWLPFPFWVMGGLMRALGPTLEVARGVAFGWAAASGVLLWAAGRVAGLSPAAAALGALLPLSSPALAPLAAATVPELPTAALATYGVAAACFGGSPAVVVAGGASLLAACLSRYEAWPLALYAAAVLAVREALRRVDGVAASTTRARARWGGARSAGVAALLALAGPIAWLVWNHLAHGDALSFARRVAAYHASVARPPLTLLEVLGGYPLAVVREVPGLLAAAALALACVRGARRRWAAALGAGAWQLVALSAAEVRGGAPTHHPERALVAIGCLLGLVVAGEGERAWRSRVGRPAGGRKARGGAWVAAGLALLTAAGAAWRARAGAADGGPSREEELALGRALGARVAPGERVLVAPSSYGYLAALVAFGRADDVTALVPKAVDPRSKADDPFESAASLARAAEQAKARWVLAAGGQRLVAEAAGLRGDPLSGPWWLYDAGRGL